MKEMAVREIMDLLHPILPDDWERVVLYCQYYERTYGIRVYVKGNGAEIYTDEAHIGYPRSHMFRIYSKINQQIAPVRQTMDDSEHWNVMTIIYERSGEINTSYEEADLLTDYQAYVRDWEDRYLTV